MFLVRVFGAVVPAIILMLTLLAPARAADSNAYVICRNQTYALCAAAKAFVYQEVSYAKCKILIGDSISAPPLAYDKGKKNICDFNATGSTNGFMASTFSLPEKIKVGGNLALYTCKGGSVGDYAQCDGGTCFKSTTGRFFPGVGMVGQDEIICSCPITKANTSIAPFGYQFIGPYPCKKKAFEACSQTAQNGDIIPVGAPTGAGRVLTEALYGRQYDINECRQ